MVAVDNPIVEVADVAEEEATVHTTIVIRARRLGKQMPKVSKTSLQKIGSESAYLMEAVQDEGLECNYSKDYP